MLMLKDARPSSWLARLIKRTMYSQLALMDAAMILIGKRQPKVSFTILDDPCSVYINFEIKKELADEFANYINLADGISLTPIRCIEGEKASLLLTLNIYEVTGLVSGARAEWSTYISDRDGISRYMVLEAQAARGSMDPVNLVTRAGRVEHSRSGNILSSRVYAKGRKQFSARLRLDESHPVAAISPEWITANDSIYWRNGVYDRVWYNGSMFNAKVRSMPPADVRIEDSSHWAQYLEPVPRHVLRYEEQLELVVSPWDNV